MEQELKQHISAALNSLYGITEATLVVEPTRSEFEGDFTFVVFPYLKQSKKGPEQTANDIGGYLQNHVAQIASFNVIKGFLNLVINKQYWVNFVAQHYTNPNYGFAPSKTKEKVLVEYSSPNTNKPLHLGHVRNNLLGFSVANILKANGYDVVMCNLVNDRGIHICKSMYAWMQQGNGETPESAGMKGDHLVGKYYVAFDKQYKAEQQELVAGGMSAEEAEKKAPSILAAQELLRKWEAGDTETVDVWKMMNGWVYSGFDVSYKNLGVSFDKFYYESNTYLLGKEIVQEGLSKNVFFKKDDGSVWVDLTGDGLDQKLLLRGDGTSVYITQDIGTAELKYKDFGAERSIYVVGNEQDYHFKVLQLICEKLGKSYAKGIYHLSYGMVELPHGKMKSREGTVVDADDLVAEMIQAAEDTTKALGKTDGLGEVELNELYQTIGLGALKYFLLKVDPRKKMLFNPAESIDFHGNTGPFIQYTYARIKSILRNAGVTDFAATTGVVPNDLENKLIQSLYQYPAVVAEAGNELSPGLIANYVYDVAKSFSHFYHECPIIKEEDACKRNLRFQLCQMTAHTIQSAFSLLGIHVPERM
ncbi:MAG: arginine--tRNA ligase [Bacteroidota bacterium]